MFSKILIANRGEIACRVIRTARRLGVDTVAVYSDADAHALHVAMADEAVHIGPPPARDSYLVVDNLIDAALRTGAEAIHPGYGFLSENADFVEAVEGSGLVFIGPSADAIRKMGLKDAAKRLMEEAGVPVVPGYHGDEQDPDFLAAEAEKIGYPVLIKASAGGGGKGMRKVDKPEDFAPALASARREASAAFGDDKVLVEKFVSKPRHIEVQIFGDGTRAVHLFERDCSLQRRHQKVIEEAPAPGMTDNVRSTMGAAAVRAAEAIGYTGAGTVEFIVDGSGGLKPDGFWFMEMNTRLQVEHPVTEAITGHDLVEWQLRVAAGAPLPVAQDDLAINGHAFEARVYAENAAKKFLPATGPLRHLRLPEGLARCDSGVRSGDRITPFYDPMIAKVITHGETRAEALGKLSRALAQTEVAGTVTNVAFLSALAAHPDFAIGNVDTGLIERDLPHLIVAADVPRSAVAVAALSALNLLDAGKGPDPWDSLIGWRNFGWPKQVAHLDWGGGYQAISVETFAAGRHHLTFDEEFGFDVSVHVRGDDLRVTMADRTTTLRMVGRGLSITVFVDGHAHDFTVADALALEDDADAGGDAVIAPMTGAVRTVLAAPGQAVREGDILVSMEAMKMEHALAAPRDGVVKSVVAAVGDQVEEGALLVALEDRPDG
ncbi:MAG: acetyl/propionyl/methylcrotonyl-CoA carboxylase subunit alpha [Pseudomonadota bacterium]